MVDSSKKPGRAGNREARTPDAPDAIARPDGRVAPASARSGTRFRGDPFAAERARLEAELADSRRNEEHLRGALAAARVGTWEWDVIEGRLTTGGDAVDVLGRGLLDVGIGGQEFLELLHPDDRDGTARAIGRSLVRAEPYRHEYRIVHPSLGERWILSEGTPVVDESGRVVRMSGIVRDVTDRKRAEEALVAAKLAAEAADLAKSEFLATMSHELRTPLTIVLGYADMLAAGEFEPLTAAQSGAVARLRRNAGELLDLISAVLDLSRLGAGRLPFDESTVSVGELLREVAEETDAAREDPAVKFELRIEDGLPPVRTDRGKLKIVLKNLVQNAFKFTEEGRVRVEARARDRGIGIEVSDTGVGIPEDELGQIFEPFRQVDVRAAGAIRGTGLGLHIVRRLMKRIGGTVDVESRVGRGSTFRIWVPAAS